MNTPKFLDLPKLSFWVVRTDHGDDGCVETLISAVHCKAEEVLIEGHEMTVITADHVRIIVPGTLWEIVEMPGIRSVSIS